MKINEISPTLLSKRTSRNQPRRWIVIVAAIMFLSSFSLLYLQPTLTIRWDDVRHKQVQGPDKEQDRVYPAKFHDGDVLRKPTIFSTSSSTGPVLVLHIGPHKTATSTIQCGMTYFRKHLLFDASVAYMSRTYHHCKGHQGHHESQQPMLDMLDMSDTRDLIDSCLESVSCNTTKVWKKLDRQLRYFSRHNISVILSDEAFSRMPIRRDGDDHTVDNYRMVFSLFNKYYPGRVHVAIVYRRYFEWMLSKWNSDNKPYKNHFHVGSNPYNERFRDWPSEGGKIPKTFRKHYESLQALNYSTIVQKEGLGGLSYNNLAEVYNMHPAEYLRRLWNNYSSHVQILDMDEMSSMQQDGDGEDIVTRFLRQILPSPLGSEIVVKLKRKGVGERIGRPNPSMNLDYDLIAVKAHQSGLLLDDASNQKETKLERYKVAQMTEKYLLKYLEDITSENATQYDIPMICLNETQQERFLQRSIKFERQLMVSTSLPKEEGNDQYDASKQQQQQQQREMKHKSSFVEAVHRNKFCNVDTIQLFRDERVHRFFRQLSAGKLGEE